MVPTFFVSLPGGQLMGAPVASEAIPDPGPGVRKPPMWRRATVKIVRLLLLVLVGFLFVLYTLQDRMIFPGASMQGTQAAVVRPRPGTELVTLATKQGEKVAALYGPALTPEGKPDLRASDRPALIYFYGNAMCLAYAEFELERFRKLGLNVIIPDYVGYGMSEGRASEKGCQATADAAYDYLVSQRGFAADRIIAGGWSLGGAVAIDLAFRRPVGGLIAFSTFTSTHDMSRTFFPIALPQWFFRHRFDSIKKVPSISCPILVGHGRLDPLVPIEMNERLAAAAKGPVTRLVIDQAEHNDFYEIGGAKIDAAIRKFIEVVEQPSR